MLNKPKDYHTTKLDVHADKTVYDLLPKQYKHLAPVGRLDRDTEGLLLFTNDGDTLYRLTHPKFDLDKVYFVTVKGYLEDVIKQKVERGVHLGPERTSPAKIQILKRKKESSEFLLTIHEGKKRQIRRMMAKLRLPVSYLKRTSHGPIKLGKLAPGYYRELTSIEIDQIRNLE
jgi:23S rRNA pseudouridine2605 synthase